MPVLDREDQSSHARLAPSSSERWIACPGSVQAQAEAVKADPSLDESNEHSRLGVSAHALLEACMIVGVPPEALIGAYLAGKDHPPVDQEMCDAVQVALGYIEEYVDTYGEENLIVLPESKLPIGPQIDITGDPEEDAVLCSGTTDVVIAHRDMSMCMTIDYKNGKGVVNAKENPQVMLYSAGARQTFGKFKKYRSVIVQPRAGKRRPVDEWEFSDATLRKFLKEKAQPSARAALLPNAPRTAGPHCTFCKASTRCRTYKDKVWAVARVEFAPIEDPDPARLSDEELLEVLDNLGLIEQYVKAVSTYALRLAQRNPRALPGWVLGWTRRTREWDDVDGVIEYCKSKGLALEQYAPRELLSPPQLSKLLRQHTKPKRRRKASDAPEPDPLEAFVKYNIPSPKLVRADAAEDFDPIE